MKKIGELYTKVNWAGKNVQTIRRCAMGFRREKQGGENCVAA